MRGNYTLGLSDLIRYIDNTNPRPDIAIQIVAFANMDPDYAICSKKGGILAGNINWRLMHAGLQYRLGILDVGVIEAPTDQVNRMLVGNQADLFAVDIPQRAGRIDSHRPKLMDFLEREDLDGHRLYNPEY